MAALSNQAVAAVDQASQAMDTVRALPAQEKKAATDAFRQANADLFPGGDKYRTQLWLTLIVGLIVVAIIALITAGVLVAKDKDSAMAIGVVTAIVAGLIGLFSKSPTSGQ
ncbi:hypothetical protein [Nocardioides okcheonensis]|uniref:hypothetical protein n=1 Tax=Nocardioides okcheonensis TaxID=2894081 RepID=UPI001E3F8A1C|nr:hypothetical protein [Nocardioides okcheonensis]UFN45820.1 hypothetical protein LN652_06305 [Nocardioides okcheonensis]